MINLIAIAAPAGSGKSEVARRLMYLYGFRRVKMAAVLKNMIRSMLQSVGYSKRAIESMVEGDLKEMPVPELGGYTTRHAMQTIGTEWGRECFDPDFWARLAFRKIDRLIGSGKRIVIDDIRFVNEREFVRSASGICVAVTGRLNETSAHLHISEQNYDQLEPEWILENNGSLEELYRTVDLMVQRYGLRSTFAGRARWAAFESYRWLSKRIESHRPILTKSAANNVASSKPDDRNGNPALFDHLYSLT